MASYPSGQRDLTVNQTASHSGVRIPHLPPNRRRPAPSFSGAGLLLFGTKCVDENARGPDPRSPPHRAPNTPHSLIDCARCGGGSVGASNPSLATKRIRTDPSFSGAGLLLFGAKWVDENAPGPDPCSPPHRAPVRSRQSGPVFLSRCSGSSRGARVTNSLHFGHVPIFC